MLTIVYGIPEWSPGAPGPSITIDLTARKPLRLNDGPYDLAEIPDSARNGTIDDKLAFLGDHLAELCGLYAKRQRQFVALYLRFIDGTVASERAAIEDVVRRYGGLFGWRDYVFSALRPLPQAHLPVSGSFERVDFAFWTGERLAAVDVVGEETRGARWTERRQRLDGAGIWPVEVPGAVLLKGGIEALGACLPREFAEFWRTETLPSSPFKAARLGDVVTGTPDF